MQMQTEKQTGKISIIVAVYNAENYLHRCMESLLGQSHRELEILVIDDGSCDRSLEICQSYASKDDRVRVFHQKNFGPAAARNVGLDHMTGAYWTVVDADDWIESNAMEVVYKAALTHQADMVIYGYRHVDDNGQWPQSDFALRQGYYYNADCEQLALDFLHKQGRKICSYLWTRLIKTSLIKEAGLRLNPAVKRSEDFLLLAQIHQMIGSAYVMTDAVLYNYYQNSASITHTYVENYVGIAHIFYDTLYKTPMTRIGHSYYKQLDKMFVSRMSLAIRIECMRKVSIIKRIAAIRKLERTETLVNALKRIGWTEGFRALRWLYLCMRLKMNWIRFFTKHR